MNLEEILESPKSAFEFGRDCSALQFFWHRKEIAEKVAEKPDATMRAVKEWPFWRLLVTPTLVEGLKQPFFTSELIKASDFNISIYRLSLIAKDVAPNLEEYASYLGKELDDAPFEYLMPYVMPHMKPSQVTYAFIHWPEDRLAVWGHALVDKVKDSPEICLQIGKEGGAKVVPYIEAMLPTIFAFEQGAVKAGEYWPDETFDPYVGKMFENIGFVQYFDVLRWWNTERVEKFKHLIGRGIAEDKELCVMVGTPTLNGVIGAGADIIMEYVVTSLKEDEEYLIKALRKWNFTDFAKLEEAAKEIGLLTEAEFYEDLGHNERRFWWEIAGEVSHDKVAQYPSKLLERAGFIYTQNLYENAFHGGFFTQYTTALENGTVEEWIVGKEETMGELERRRGAMTHESGTFWRKLVSEVGPEQALQLSGGDFTHVETAYKFMRQSVRRITPYDSEKVGEYYLAFFAGLRSAIEEGYHKEWLHHILETIQDGATGGGNYRTLFARDVA